jgi:hypothetical protein
MFAARRRARITICTGRLLHNSRCTVVGEERFARREEIIMKRRMAQVVMCLALGIGACVEPPAAPEAARTDGLMLAPRSLRGTGLLIENLTEVSLPVLGPAGSLVIDQLIITDLMLVEDAVGVLLGLEATGMVTGTLTATGVPIVNQRFTSTFAITSSGPGQCELVTVDLGPLRIDALNLLTAEVPTAGVTARGSGAIGSLLCNLGNVLSGTIGGLTRGVGGLVNAINRLI